MTTATANRNITNSTAFKLNRYITVTASNCTLKGDGYDNNAVLTVSNIKRGSKLYFQSPNNYPLADQNWFHFTDAQKNVYFDNNVKVNPTGEQGITISFIEFTESPNAANTKNSNPISTTFDIVNENGFVNDPTLIIEW
ncbi:hypothetical protein [Vibrio cionasavignyae]|uniref:hypothetical protein n=1 Tax=Vibrio cionasavignyae TaxID=2910252 RepID=UPI003D0CA6F0